VTSLPSARAVRGSSSEAEQSNPGGVSDPVGGSAVQCMLVWIEGIGPAMIELEEDEPAPAD
jgi:hypothetical protein